MLNAGRLCRIQKSKTGECTNEKRGDFDDEMFSQESTYHHISEIMPVNSLPDVATVRAMINL